MRAVADSSSPTYNVCALNIACRAVFSLWLGCLYQVVDVVIASAEPTEDLDAITVGMVCIRNLQVCRIVINWHLVP